MNKLKIYIIEDHKIISLLLQKMIPLMGYHLIGNSDGEFAIKEIQTLKPDVVISDIRLGRILDGLDIIQEAKKTTDFITIFLTGGMDDEKEIQRRGIEYCKFLLKPITMEQLKTTIEDCVNKRNVG